MDPADFIQEVPTDSGVEFLRPGMRHLNAKELEAAYKASPYYREVMRVLEASDDPTKVQCSTVQHSTLKYRPRYRTA